MEPTSEKDASKAKEGQGNGGGGATGIQVTVTYTGHPPFQATEAGSVTVGEVKLAAMKQFGLEAASASKYVMQHDGADTPDGTALDAFGKRALAFQLQLKKEVNKG